MKRGGTVCIFTIGKPGTSATHLRYIARERAGEEDKRSLLCLRLPDFLVWETERQWFVREVVRWVRAEEQEELRRYRGHGVARTHYRAILSFEEDIGAASALSLVKNWLDTVLPHARACAFLHRNTAHLHAHLWIAARQVNGRKINLSARTYRQLDEHWNRLYAEALGRDVQEHLIKKWEMRTYKQLRRAGQAMERPERASHSWTPALFTVRERERLEGRSKEDDRDEKGVGADKPQASRDALTLETREHATADEQRPSPAESDPVQRATEDAEQAVSEAQRLHQDAQRVAQQEPEQERIVERER